MLIESQYLLSFLFRKSPSWEHQWFEQQYFFAGGKVKRDHILAPGVELKIAIWIRKQHILLRALEKFSAERERRLLFMVCPCLSLTFCCLWTPPLRTAAITRSQPPAQLPLKPSSRNTMHLVCGVFRHVWFEFVQLWTLRRVETNSF